MLIKVDGAALVPSEASEVLSPALRIDSTPSVGVEGCVGPKLPRI